MIPLITTADLVEFQVLARSENIPPKSEAHPLPLLVRISALFPDILSVLCWSLSSTNRFGICNYFFQDLVFDVDWRAQMTLQSRRREGRGTKHNRKVFFYFIFSCWQPAQRHEPPKRFLFLGGDLLLCPALWKTSLLFPAEILDLCFLCLFGIIFYRLKACFPSFFHMVISIGAHR